MTFPYGTMYDFRNQETPYVGASWDELIGIDDAKQKLQDLFTGWKKRGFFLKTRLPFRPTLLLVGPPGTGKTSVILAFGKKENIPIAILQPTQIIRSGLGQSGENLSNAFLYVKEEAQKELKHPFILFLDEFDSFARERDDPTEIGEMKRLVNTLLTEMDNLVFNQHNVFIIGSTNHDQNLDSAAFRRFAVMVNFKFPNELLRERIWLEYEQRIQVVLSKTKWEVDPLVQKTEGYTAADIERVLVAAVMDYLHNKKESITTAMLLDQLKFVRSTKLITKTTGNNENVFDSELLDLYNLKEE